MIKLFCMFEIELTVGLEDKERFKSDGEKGFTEIQASILEMLQRESDNPVTITSFEINEFYEVPI